MILYKCGKIRPGFLIKSKDTGEYYTTKWDNSLKCILAVKKNRRVFNPSLQYFDIIGELKKDIEYNSDGSFSLKQNLKFEVNDIYELKNEKGIIKDVIIITKIIKNPILYHLLHKNGTVEILSEGEFLLLNLEPKNKKYLNVHYQIRR